MKKSCMGYNSSKNLLPQQQFQFADDLATTSSTERDSQLLLNVFNKCCTWAGLIVYVDKYLTFGINKKIIRQENSNYNLKYTMKTFYQSNLMRLLCILQNNIFIYNECRQSKIRVNKII